MVMGNASGSAPTCNVFDHYIHDVFGTFWCDNQQSRVRVYVQDSHNMTGDGLRPYLLRYVPGTYSIYTYYGTNGTMVSNNKIPPFLSNVGPQL